MVYCGKPSKGCANCRGRKIRCDQREPGCSQCEKKRQQCPGYRNTVDVMFKDMSSHVIEKAKAKEKAKEKARGKDVVSAESGSLPDTTSGTSSALVNPKPRGKPLTPITQPHRLVQPACGWTPDDSLLPSPDSGTWPTTPMIAMLYSLAPTFQERGTACFFSRYVTIDKNTCHQRFDFVYDIWKPITLLPERQVDGVLASMTAVGLVGLANMTKSKEILEAARKSYGTALLQTNNALRSPTEAIKDTTMLSVLILGLFEMMTESSRQTMKAWQEHVNGAATLAKLRGMSQFRTKAGVKMFKMLWQSVTISCIQNQIPMPPTLADLRNELAKLFKTKEPGIEISTPIYKVLQVRYDIKNDNITDLETMLEKLNEVEDEFEHLISNFPDSWQYRVFRVTRPHFAVFQSIAHIYPSIWNATVWNGFRTCRILILETILGELHKEFHDIPQEHIHEKYQMEYQKARGKLERIVRAIAASVPQHCGLVNSLGTYHDTLTPLFTVEKDTTTTSSDSGSPISPRKPTSPGLNKSIDDYDGPTVMNPTLAKGPQEEAERFMLLTSATSTIVWPLYLVGMSSVCTQALRTYVIERLMAVWKETGLAQAKCVAEIVSNRQPSPDSLTLPVRPHDNGFVRRWSNIIHCEEQEHLVLPV